MSTSRGGATYWTLTTLGVLGGVLGVLGVVSPDRHRPGTQILPRRRTVGSTRRGRRRCASWVDQKAAARRA